MTLLRGDSRHMPRQMAARALLIFLLGCNTAVVADELPDAVAATWRGEPVCETLSETAEMRVFRCIFPPGVGHERHFHARHFGYALSGGRMRITDAAGSREVSLQTGTYFSSDGIPWHEVLNVGNTVVSYLMIEPR
jgi:hypothetical protein